MKRLIMKRSTIKPSTVKRWMTALTLSVCAAYTMAENSVTIPVNAVDEKGVSTAVGQVTVTESKYGLVFTPSLAGLPAGLHGFHVHENPSCAAKEKDGKNVAALAAGAHYDPKKSGAHGFPWSEGHLGDLPALYVDADGNASQPVLAPRLKLKDIHARALMIHA